MTEKNLIIVHHPYPEDQTAAVLRGTAMEYGGHLHWIGKTLTVYAFEFAATMWPCINVLLGLGFNARTYVEGVDFKVLDHNAAAEADDDSALDTNERNRFGGIRDSCPTRSSADRIVAAIEEVTEAVEQSAVDITSQLADDHDRTMAALSDIESAVVGVDDAITCHELREETIHIDEKLWTKTDEGDTAKDSLVEQLDRGEVVSLMDQDKYVRMCEDMKVSKSVSTSIIHSILDHYGWDSYLTHLRKIKDLRHPMVRWQEKQDARPRPITLSLDDMPARYSAFLSADMEDYVLSGCEEHEIDRIMEACGWTEDYDRHTLRRYALEYRSLWEYIKNTRQKYGRKSWIAMYLYELYGTGDETDGLRKYTISVRGSRDAYMQSLSKLAEKINEAGFPFVVQTSAEDDARINIWSNCLDHLHFASDFKVVNDDVVEGQTTRAWFRLENGGFKMISVVQHA